jgi:hypothetical protein
MNWRIVIRAATMGVAVSVGFLIYGFLADWMHFYPVDLKVFFIFNPGMLLDFPVMMALSGVPATFENELLSWCGLWVGTIANGFFYGLIGLFVERFIPRAKRSVSNPQ